MGKKSRDRLFGKLYGIGVGPGDPELLTLKAHRILQKVDIITAPCSRKGRTSLALKIIQQELDCQGRVLELFFPMTHNEDTLKEYWKSAAGRIGNLLADGKDIAFITLGDPLLYSTYIYLLENLRAEESSFEIETIPGITSISASSARLNQALTTGDEKLVVIPATYEIDRLEEALREHDNIVLLKVASHYDRIIRLLEKLKLLKEAVFISRCGQPEEMVVRDLTSLTGEEIDYLSLIIIRKRQLSLS